MNFVTFADWLKDAPDWILKLPKGIQDFIYQLYQSLIYADRWKLLVDGLKITFIITIGALILGVIIGMFIAIIRTTHDLSTNKPNFILKFFNWFCNIYLTVIRGTPMMVQLLIMGFVVMTPITDFGTIMCGIVTLGINSGAYVAEIARSGIMSIDKGQMEAGRSLGFNYVKTMWYIIIPQAFKNILPALGNEMITLLKDTSLVSVIALRDVTMQAKNIQNLTYQAFVPYITLALIYLVIVVVLTKLLNILERRLRNSDH